MSNASQTMCWITDPHFNFLRHPNATKAFAESLIQERLEHLHGSLDAFLITGDISEAPHVVYHLQQFAEGAGDRPVYFVLGNHDFYRGSFKEVRSSVQELCDWHPTLYYLTGATEPIKLTETLYLVGDDGWYDAMAGNAMRSPVLMSDFEYITEIRQLYWPVQSLQSFFSLPDTRKTLVAYLNELGKESAERARIPLYEAARLGAKEILFATHVPPFREAAWHEGKLSDDDWVPFFSHIQMGAMLTQFCKEHPRIRVQVRCGHTHGSGTFLPLDVQNLRVYTGAARYGLPDKAEWFTYAEELE